MDGPRTVDPARLDEALRAFVDHPVRWRLATEPRRIPFTIDEQLDALWLERIP